MRKRGGLTNPTADEGNSQMFENVPINAPGPEYIRMSSLVALARQYDNQTPTIIDEAVRLMKDETFYIWVWTLVMLMQIGFLCFDNGNSFATALSCFFTVLFAVWLVRDCRRLIGARYIRDILQEGTDIIRTGGRRVPPTPSRDVFTWWWQESLNGLRRGEDAHC